MKTQKGITLIALVITIIVMLILAGVTIRLSVGEEGILSRAEKAADETEEAQAKEDVGLAWTSTYAEYIDTMTDNDDIEKHTFFTKENLNKNLTGKGRVKELEYNPDGISKITYENENGKEYNFIIGKTGGVKSAEESLDTTDSE